MEEIKLHLGGGKVDIPNYTNIDLADYPHIDYKQDIKDLSMFPDNSVSVIYCSHALEYYDREEGEWALREWYRVLKSSGILRVAVPDFEAIIKVYQKYSSINHEGILGPLYGRMSISGTNDMIYHKTIYDYDSLCDLLKSIEFRNIHRYDWRETEHANIDDFSKAYVPCFDFENGILVSLNIEATK